MRRHYRFCLSGWGSDDIPMEQAISHVFQPGLTILHTYDFGTESNTLIKAIGSREGMCGYIGPAEPPYGQEGPRGAAPDPMR